MSRNKDRLRIGPLVEGLEFRVGYQTTAWYGHVIMPPGWPQAWLEEAPFGAVIGESGKDGGCWSSVGLCESEDEARERCCAVMGFVVGRCLTRELGEKVVPAHTLPGRARAVFR